MTLFAGVLGIFYFVVGAAKLAGARPLAEQFDEFGLNPNIMKAVGALEVAAGIGLQIDQLHILAVAGMILMMGGALFNHRRVGHPPQALAPALIVLAASVVFLLLAACGEHATAVRKTRNAAAQGRGIQRVVGLVS